MLILFKSLQSPSRVSREWGGAYIRY